MNRDYLPLSNTGVVTDLYQLTVAQGYFSHKRDNRSVFEMFFRREPFNGGYSIFAGLEPLIEKIGNFRYDEGQLAYLSSLNLFSDDFLSMLKEFRFKGDLFSVEEGSLVFPQEPLIRVHGTLIECQLLESLILNTINFQTLIATKAARIVTTAKGGDVIEFGLRRAQGIDGALSASRAAFIGGVAGTSNVHAGYLYNIPVKGTMAHSWIMTFDSEEEAFRAFAKIYPENPIFLIDTYDTLSSGIESAIKVGKELKKRGGRFGVRLDSGDLQYLSRKVRQRLDEEGFPEAKIVVSNDLDEQIINQLVLDNSPINSWGVGTKLVSGDSDPSLSGVYKIIQYEREGEKKSVMKLSNNQEKITIPGIKQLYRFYREGAPLADLITLDEESISSGHSYRFYHPLFEHDFFTVNSSEYDTVEPLLTCRIRSGERCRPAEPLVTIRERVVKELNSLDATYKRLINPHRYKVSLSTSLKEMKHSMIESLKN